ncbi:hypothetical protein BDW62DRAFT_97041 [Aspergillus aurantiobrunneus]
MGENGLPPSWYRSHAKPSGIDLMSASQTDQAESNGDSPSSHEPEIYDIEDLPADTQGHCYGDKTVKPYAVEEPDDEATFEPEGTKPQPHVQRRYWEDLVDSMEELHCDSDNSNPGLIFPKRGRKRKPADPSNVHQSSQSRQSTSVPDVQYERPNLSPKRPRKKDEHPKEPQGKLKPAQRRHIRRHRGLSGSSNTSVSTDTSGANFTKGSPALDAMDLD